MELIIGGWNSSPTLLHWGKQWQGGKLWQGAGRWEPGSLAPTTCPLPTCHLSLLLPAPTACARQHLPSLCSACAPWDLPFCPLPPWCLLPTTPCPLSPQASDPCVFALRQLPPHGACTFPPLATCHLHTLFPLPLLLTLSYGSRSSLEYSTHGGSGSHPAWQQWQPRPWFTA